MTDEVVRTKIYDFIKCNLINFIVILTSLAYVFYNMVSIERTDYTVEEAIVGAGLGIIVGLLIKQGLGENGFTKGYRSLIWRDNLEKYSKACNSAVKYIERIDNFYYTEEIEKRRTYRRQMLMNAHIKYEWFFDKLGNYIENEEQYAKLNRYQRKILNKCVRVKIYNLNLFSEYNNDTVASTKKEFTDKTQRAKMLGKNSIIQVLVAILGVYFVATWKNWDWGSFITATIQISIWVTCGVIQLYSNYNYVVLDKVSKMQRKIELLVKFEKGCDNGLYLKNPYDDDNDNEIKEILEENGNGTRECESNT